MAKSLAVGEHYERLVDAMKSAIASFEDRTSQALLAILALSIGTASVIGLSNVGASARAEA